jgi:hypothetical protein
MEYFQNKKLSVQWGPGNNKTKKENVYKHYLKHALSDENQFWELILNDINCESYMKYTIGIFYKLSRVLIHTNGTNVYMSGFYNNVFVVGRYEGDVFGISSCYYIESGEKLGRWKNVCYKF